jgi:hypothetical protein
VSEPIVHIERGHKDESRDLELSIAIQTALQREYPNHYWLVSFTGHAIIVRHVLIASLVSVETGQEGFGSLLPKNKTGTVHETEQEAIKHAGALLEAFKLPRGAWNGADIPAMPADLKAEILSRRRLRYWKVR